MRLLFVADGRSPTTLSWLEYWIESYDEVHLISTYPCTAPAGLATFHLIPVAFSRLAGGGKATLRKHVISRMRDPLRIVRTILGPISLLGYKRQFQQVVDSIKPDLIHALRIPFEGMLSDIPKRNVPLIISTWGNDLTLHAKSSPIMASLTRKVLNHADALISDTRRDERLGFDWGLRPNAPTMIIPGAGGIRLEKINQPERVTKFPEDLPEGSLVVNPRGQRPGSLRQDVFFRAIPRVLEKHPDTYFICPILRGDPNVEKWVTSLGITQHTRLWPKLSQAELWSLLIKSQVFVSPSLNDGTPNSLLEAMACGCFPVIGNIESMKEWINDGINGFLVDANDEFALAGAIVRALNEPALRVQAAKVNAALVAERADYVRNMRGVRDLYESLLRGS